MSAISQAAITDSFLGFASKASNILHIKSDEDYSDALKTVEHLFSEATDTVDNPLNELIELISKSISDYESTKEDIVNFEVSARNIPQEISVLRVLMAQYKLTISDFEEEIGSKSLVSMMLDGRKNLTKEHIAKLSRRYNLNPSIFFDLELV